MANLFFIHTPMQLFVAQQLINQERLGDNIMLYGYNGNHKGFLDTYDIMIIESMWSDRFFMNKLNQWAAMGFGDLGSFKRCRHNLNTIESIILKYTIDAIYFGDIDNFSHLFGTLVFGKECRIVFFEEGSSQYTYKDRLPDKNPIRLFSSWLLDILVYKPFFKISFRKYRRHLDVASYDLPIYRRYSIIPGILNEPFDRVLKVEKLFSDRLLKLIKEQIKLVSEESNIHFLITSDVYAGIDKNHRYCNYLNTVADYLRSLDISSFVLLKLHPNEGIEQQKDLEGLMRKVGIRYYVLPSDIKIPVEYYLQIFEPLEIAHFMSSTVFYNGFIFPQCSDTNLFMPFFKKCISDGLNMDNVYGLYMACHKD